MPLPPTFISTWFIQQLLQNAVACRTQNDVCLMQMKNWKTFHFTWVAFERSLDAVQLLESLDMPLRCEALIQLKVLESDFHLNVDTTLETDSMHSPSETKQSNRRPIHIRRKSDAL